MATDVVVVGAGPVGLVAAAELARRGLGVRIVDKLAAPTTESRAILLHARSLELLDQLGVAARLLDTGVRTRAMKMYSAGREIAGVGFDGVDSAFPFSLTTAQTETERVLTERLAELGVTIDRGVELTGLTQDADGVQVTLSHADGSVERADVAWVVGADGGHSSVRHLVGTKLVGSFKGETFALGDIEGEHQFDSDSMYVYYDAAGPLLVFPMLGHRIRVIAQVEQSAAEPTRESLQQIIDQRGAGAIRITDSHWLTNFEIHHAQVPAYRHGRVFLAGDAAHVHSPAGGQGMNTGIQDATNLAWKLASTVDGRGGDRLLDSYHDERHPVAAEVIESTTKMTQLGTLDNKVAAWLRNEVLHAATGLAPVQHVLADQLEETALRYRRSPIVVDLHPHHVRVRAGDHAPHVTDPAVQAALRAAIGATSGHVVLTVGSAPAGAAVPGAAAVLVTDRPGTAPGYDAVVSDRDGAVAARYGFENGGRAVIRPDGYLGLVGDLDADVDAYFARITG